MKLAVYPGSFDPFTNGHLDIVKRARLVFDRVIVAIAHNSSKTALFSVEERRAMIVDVLHETAGVEVAHFSGLLVDFALETGAIAVVRGLRAVTDFEYEHAMFQINHEMAPGVETVFLLADSVHSFVSSSLIKEVARYGRDVGRYTPKAVNRELLKKFGHGE